MATAHLIAHFASMRVVGVLDLLIGFPMAAMLVLMGLAIDRFGIGGAQIESSTRQALDVISSLKALRASTSRQPAAAAQCRCRTVQ